jgi:hypothetical protein
MFFALSSSEAVHPPSRKIWVPTDIIEWEERGLGAKLGIIFNFTHSFAIPELMS